MLEEQPKWVQLLIMNSIRFSISKNTFSGYLYIAAAEHGVRTRIPFILFWEYGAPGCPSDHTLDSIWRRGGEQKIKGIHDRSIVDGQLY